MDNRRRMMWKKPQINAIYYTSTDGKVINVNSSTDWGGAKLVSNTYKNGQGVMLFDKPVTKVGGFASKYNLLTIELPDSVTTIAASAFDQCRYLQRINIPESVTEVGSSAFQTCSALAEVHITNLTKYLNIKFPNYSTHVSYGGLYVNGVLLTDLVIPAGIESIGKCAFYSYSHLKNIIIPDSVTSIGEYAFSSCKNLERVTIGKGVKNFGSSTFVSSTGELYINCNIPNNSTGIFYKTLFTKVTIGDNVTSIGNNAFRQCTSLREVIVGDNVASIGDRAFDSCSNLARINMPNNITSIGSYAFNNCSGLQRLDIDNLAAWCRVSLTSTYSHPLNVSGGSVYINNVKVTELIIPDSVTSIAGLAFSRCTSLTSVTIPNSVTSIGNNAFSYCTSLTSITIPDSVTSIEYGAFYNCTSLTSVTIGNGVTSIGDSAFNGCTGKLVINSKIVEIDTNSTTGWLSWSKFTELVIGSNIEKIGQGAFQSNTSIINVSISNGVTSIGNNAFSVSNLASVTIPESVTKIGEKAFYQCNSLKEIYCKPTTPPTGGYNMFYTSYSGRSIYVPRNSVSAYKSASYWSNYSSYIVGYDF